MNKRKQTQIGETELNFKTRMSLAIGASALIIGSASFAHAQTDESVVDDASELALDTIVVQGLKRGERSLVDVPVAIAVIDGDDIEDLGADSLTDFLQLAPGVSISQNDAVGASNIQIRGQNTAFGAASVGFYLDGLPFSFVNINLLPDPNPFDLESVEVLKGPQGTLYGAGAASGVVLVNTNSPVLNEYQARMDVAVSSTEGGGANYSGSGVVNIPIIDDKVALRGVISYQDLSGFIDDSTVVGLEDINSQDRLSGRVKLLVEPTENLSIELLGNFSRIGADFGAEIADDAGNFPQTGALTLFQGFVPGLKDSFQDVDYDQFGATFEYEGPGFDIFNALGYIDFSSRGVEPALSPRAVETIANAESLTNEFRISSNHSGPVSWLAGVFVRDTEQVAFQDLLGVLAVDPINLPSANVDDFAESQQVVGFGEATLQMLDGALELNAGASYLRDETKNRTTIAGLSQNPVLDLFFDEQATNEVSSNVTSPQASIAYRPTENSTVFFRYAQGVRPATVDFGITTFLANVAPVLTGVGAIANGSVEEEITEALELGAKGTFFDGGLYVEANAFSNSISDVQQNAEVSTPVGAFTTVLNAGDATSTGFEWLVIAKPTDSLDLTFSGAYTDAKVDGDFFGPGQNPATDVPLFSDGTRLNLVPELTLNGSVGYQQTFGENYSLHGSASVQYASERDQLIVGSPSVSGDETLRADLRLAVSRDFWEVYGFVENATNESGAVTPRTADDLNGLQALLNIDGRFGTRMRPRTIGAGLKLRY